MDRYFAIVYDDGVGNGHQNIKVVKGTKARDKFLSEHPGSYVGSKSDEGVSEKDFKKSTAYLNTYSAVEKRNNTSLKADAAQDNRQSGGEAQDDVVKDELAIETGRELEKDSTQSEESAKEKAATTIANSSAITQQQKDLADAETKKALADAEAKRLENEKKQRIVDAYSDNTNLTDKADFSGINEGGSTKLEGSEFTLEEPPNNKGEGQPGQGGNNNNNKGASTNKDNKGASNKLWDAYKSGGLDGYPTLKAVADIISNNARMNMDRAALLTGGQRDLDAYKPIETETDKIRDKQVDERAKLGGYTLNDAIKAAKNGDYSLLQNAIGQDLITVENAAMSLNMSPETLNKQFSTSEKKIENEGKLSDLEVKSKELGLTVEQFNSEQAVQSKINECNDKIRNCEEAKAALNGHDWKKYEEVSGVLARLSKDVEKSGNATTIQSSSGGSANGGGSFFDIAKAEAEGHWDSGDSSTSTSQTDTFYKNSLPDIQAKAQAAMEGQDKANNELIKFYDDLIVGYKKERTILQGQLNTLRKQHNVNTNVTQSKPRATIPTDNGEGEKAE